MKVTLNWLKEYVDIDLSAEELADRLDLTGTAVESLNYLGGNLDKVVVGEIRSIEPHPGADRLTYCDVAVNRRVAKIVCGAKNIKVGDKVPVALPGAVLPGERRIEATEIRGVTSEGMMCSEAELGVGPDAAGILILPAAAKVGGSVSAALGLDDWLFDLEITPNRPDCLGVIGIAREVAAVLDRKLRRPEPKVVEIDKPIESQATVEILDPDLCPRYGARLLEGVKVGPSPLWLRRRLETVGFRPINNLVDVTNYVMMISGQPLHAFDFDRLGGGKVVVRRARAGEKLETIDHVERELAEDMLVIADVVRPVALAGVMGGAGTEISDATTRVLIESANFKAANIMRTSRALGLVSESSYRFEKGVDIDGVIYALDVAAELMAQVSEGRVLKGQIDDYPAPQPPVAVSLRPDRVNLVLGTKLSREEIAGYLTRLELRVADGAKERPLSVTVPTFRVDLEREIDLIEEVARLYGLNRIASTLPLSTAKERGLTPEQKQRQKLRALLIGAGLTEVINYSFTSRDELAGVGIEADHPWLAQAVPLANPLSEDQSLLRTTVIAGLMRTVTHNYNRGQTGIQVFELGRSFFGRPGERVPEEISQVGGALTGAWREAEWFAPRRPIDFFDVKGVIELLARELRLVDHHWRPGRHPSLHEGLAAELVSEEETIGFCGQLHPRVQERYGLRQPVYLFQINVDKLLRHLQPPGKFVEPPRFPAVQLDLALVVDERVSWGHVESVVREAGGPLLREVHLFDLYRGPGVPEGKKSFAFSLTYQAGDRTLTDDEVAHVQRHVIRRCEEELGASLR